MDTKIGLIGFYDILGYENLLMNNEPEDIAKTVLPILAGIGDYAKEFLLEFNQLATVKDEIHSEKLKITENIINAITPLVFSDTILLTMPFDTDSDLSRSFSWMIFTLASHSIMHNMFKNGLPLKGVIDYGRFYVKDTSFAGKTIVNAYNLCKQMDLSACVLSDNAKEEYEKTINETGVGQDVFSSFYSKYLVPLKEQEKHLMVQRVNVLKETEDIRTQVFSAFFKHNKDIPESAMSKVTNTEKWLYYLRSLDTEVDEAQPVAEEGSAGSPIKGDSSV